jgi:ABC-type phosphate transport system substrate-binding protein
MKVKKLSVIMVFFLLLCLGKDALAAGGIVVIVNKSNPITGIDKGKLASIYRSENETWDNGQKIVIINQAIGTDARERFYRSVLMSPASTKFYIAGTMAPITTVVQKSDKAVKLFVSNMSSALGYISEDALDDSVKAILVDGKKTVD